MQIWRHSSVKGIRWISCSTAFFILFLSFYFLMSRTQTFRWGLMHVAPSHRPALMCHQQQSGRASGLVGRQTLFNSDVTTSRQRGGEGGRWEVGGRENTQISKTGWQRAKAPVHGLLACVLNQSLYSWLNSMSSFLTKQTNEIMSRAGLVTSKLQRTVDRNKRLSHYFNCLRVWKSKLSLKWVIDVMSDHFWRKRCEDKSRITARKAEGELQRPASLILLQHQAHIQLQ